MSTTVRVSRQLLDAIEGFRETYKDDKNFTDVLKALNGVEQDVEKLVPDTADKTADGADRTPAEKATERATKYVKDSKNT